MTTALEDKLREVWARKIGETSVCSDLPRLARRIKIQDYDPSRKTSLSISIPKVEEANAGTTTLSSSLLSSSGGSDMGALIQVIVEVITGVATRLETEEQQNVTKQQLESFANEAQTSGNLQLAMEGLFKQGIGDGSKITGVFKAINQSVIIPALTHWRTILNGVMTKDVRGEDGWKILIDFRENEVVVGHTRKEQSLDQHGTPDHWIYEWSLKFHFDREMKGILGIDLDVLSVATNKNMSKEKLQQLKDTFEKGGFSKIVWLEDDSLPLTSPRNSVFTPRQILTSPREEPSTSSTPPTARKKTSTKSETKVDEGGQNAGGNCNLL
eukprot:TRINITY_DN7608_c0_g1_i1.p1 TRINITY_DN7608_c0_g1~~TRINITY_DN7608_c0_g1_i1.p1  ORF type:complete len:326 (+),score=67.64 TRINITY_DN7608_c0_g1_i1:145-1122(+)